METPSLVTERLNLRPISPNDIDFIFKLFKRSETNKYSEYPDLKTWDEAMEMYEGYLKPGFESHFRVIIEKKDTETPIGTIGFYKYSETHKRAEMGYDLLKEYWGNGYVTEAVRAISDYGFNDLGLIRIEATVDPENSRSIRVLERTGFKHEGTLLKRYYYRGSFHDELYYGIIKE
jgi:RimJ/RimL family protein N-acetyltransferase